MDRTTPIKPFIGQNLDKIKDSREEKRTHFRSDGKLLLGIGVIM